VTVRRTEAAAAPQAAQLLRRLSMTSRLEQLTVSALEDGEQGEPEEDVPSSPQFASFSPCATLDCSVLSSIVGGSRSDLSLHSEIAPDHRSHGVLPGGH